jgi:hypothetical protein
MHTAQRIKIGICALAIIAANMVSHNAFAQTATTQTAPHKSGSFITLNGTLSSGKILSENGVNSLQTLGNMSLGWFGYCDHFSSEVQFSISPLIGSLTASNVLFPSKTNLVDVWFGYSVFENEMLRISPTIGAGLYRFNDNAMPEFRNVFVSAGVSGEFFIPNSPIMLGLRAGYQHNFGFSAASDVARSNAGGIFVQVRTGVRLQSLFELFSGNKGVAEKPKE